MTGVMWTYAATAARLAMQVVLTAILARVLGPESFGIVGMGLAVVGLVGFVVDQGLTSALIQRSALSVEQIRTAFTRLLAASLTATAVCIAASGWIAGMFREPALRAPMIALAFLFVPAALSSVSLALLRRQLRIREIQTVNVAAYAVGYGLVAVPMALMGFGLWSLVTASIVHVCAVALAYYALTRHPVRLLRGGSDGLSRFGSRAALAGLLSWFTETFPGIVIGRTLGAAILGVFNAALNVARTPASAMATGGLEMLFASSARAEDSVTFRQRAFKVASGLVAMVSLPAFVTLALVAETTLIVLYGPKWTAAIPLLPPLALAMPALMLAGVAGAMLAAMGRPGQDFLVQAATASVLAIAVVLAVDHTVEAVTWAFLAAMVLRSLLAMRLALALAQLRWRDLAAAVRTGLFLAVLIPPLVYLLDRYLSILQVHRAVVLLADAILGAALLVLGVAALRATMPHETRWAVAQALRRIPFGLAARFAPRFEQEAPGRSA